MAFDQRGLSATPPCIGGRVGGGNQKVPAPALAHGYVSSNVMLTLASSPACLPRSGSGPRRRRRPSGSSPPANGPSAFADRRDLAERATGSGGEDLCTSARVADRRLQRLAVERRLVVDGERRAVDLVGARRDRRVDHRAGLLDVDRRADDVRGGVALELPVVAERLGQRDGLRADIPASGCLDGIDHLAHRACVRGERTLGGVTRLLTPREREARVGTATTEPEPPTVTKSAAGALSTAWAPSGLATPTRAAAASSRAAAMATRLIRSSGRWVHPRYAAGPAVRHMAVAEAPAHLGERFTNAPRPRRGSGGNAVRRRARCGKRAVPHTRGHTLVRFAERHACPNERLRGVGREHERVGGCGCQTLAVDPETGDEHVSARRPSRTSRRVANTGALSSCRSRSYASGRPFTVASRPASRRSRCPPCRAPAPQHPGSASAASSTSPLQPTPAAARSRTHGSTTARSPRRSARGGCRGTVAA